MSSVKANHDCITSFRPLGTLVFVCSRFIHSLFSNISHPKLGPNSLAFSSNTVRMHGPEDAPTVICGWPHTDKTMMEILRPGDADERVEKMVVGPGPDPKYICGWPVADSEMADRLHPNDAEE
ncbi:hypothetical protein PRIPAC_97343 [Pristionchus pacificus]|uniref:Uncharacterized protein n=1 Tax=Pristionchus pacificus TaxID=54126 RepID=A0A2A6BIL6_PRIPA|nr:hypothetical protein PRIPAC_97343 [Pristionchus pacificus]|eukprot:PDM65775.1 hypothetical protein PRIPAC_45176 [Pristionchus pacificus]